jgi:hypothetical protein
MNSPDSGDDLSRRDVLRSSAGAFGFGGASGLFGGGGLPIPNPCPDVTVEPNVEHYGDHGLGPCSDDHPDTESLQNAVAESLETNYPTVGALIDDGYVPYFDFVAAEGESGWSHWLNPEYLGNDGVVDPQRPESILVGHRWWRPIGVMFIATRDGGRVDQPPAVYSTDDGACRPWHAHTGVPGLYAWLKYWLTFGDRSLSELTNFPCRTPWMLHVWAYPHPDSVYAHGAPPPGNRGGPPAEDAGFETSAEPGEDLLSPAVLPDALVHRIPYL